MFQIRNASAPIALALAFLVAGTAQPWAASAWAAGPRPGVSGSHVNARPSANEPKATRRWRRAFDRGVLKLLVAATFSQSVQGDLLELPGRPSPEQRLEFANRYSDLGSGTDLAAYRHENDVKLHDGTSFLRTSQSRHQARFLAEGAEALETRLRMIDEARESIDLSYFIYGHSPSGVLVTQALIAKKARDPGVRIRILLDYFSGTGEPGLSPHEIAYLNQRGIEVSFFNRSTAYQFWKVVHRDHTKLMIVDREQLVTGGRNISDDDFAFSSAYFNFIDADVWVRGEAASTAAERFEAYWTSAPLVQPGAAAKPGSPGYDREMRRIDEMLRPTAQTEALRDRVRVLGEKQLSENPVFDVGSVTFVSDRPGSQRTDRVTLPYLKHRISLAKRSVEIENYIFMPEPELMRLLEALPANSVATTALTNGFSAVGDDARLIFLARPEKRRLSRAGVRIHEFQGKPLPHKQSVDVYGEGDPGMEAIHSKFGIIDGLHTYVLSENFDWLSARSNDEGGIFINDSPEFAAHVREVMKKRREGAKELSPGAATYVDGTPANAGMKPEAYRKGEKENLLLYRWLKWLF